MKISFFFTGFMPFIVLVLFAVSCGSEPRKVSPQADAVSLENTNTVFQGTHIPKNVAAQQALQLRKMLWNSTLRNENIVVESIESLAELTGLRSNGDADTIPSLYVVNFANSNGYAIISDDIRMQPVWAIAEHGNLDLNDKLESADGGFILNQIATTFSLAVNGLVDHFDIDGNGPKKPIDFDPDYDPIAEVSNLVFGAWELVPESQDGCILPVEWEQSSIPFNLYTKDKYNSDHAGCVTAAVAQIMAYYQHPKKYNWSLMLKHHPYGQPLENYPPAYAEIGKLYYDLGQSLKVKYGVNASSAFEEDVPRTFKTFGYGSPGYLTNYNIGNIIGQLTGKRGRRKPVYISATDSAKVEVLYPLWRTPIIKEYKKSGHAFVLDGYARARQPLYYIHKNTGDTLKTKYYDQPLFHANLGWAPWSSYNAPKTVTKNFNGYYNVFVFDTMKGPKFQHNKTKKEETVWRGESRVYRYNFQTIMNIEP